LVHFAKILVAVQQTLKTYSNISWLKNIFPLDSVVTVVDLEVVTNLTSTRSWPWPQLTARGPGFRQNTDFDKGIHFCPSGIFFFSKFTPTYTNSPQQD